MKQKTNQPTIKRKQQMKINLKKTNEVFSIKKFVTVLEEINCSINDININLNKHTLLILLESKTITNDVPSYLLKH